MATKKQKKQWARELSSFIVSMEMSDYFKKYEDYFLMTSAGWIYYRHLYPTKPTFEDINEPTRTLKKEIEVMKRRVKFTEEGPELNALKVYIDVLTEFCK